MKKRLAGILLSCILAVSLTACGGGSDNSAAAADSRSSDACDPWKENCNDLSGTDDIFESGIYNWTAAG